MKKLFKLLGIIAIAAIIGFGMTSCDQLNDLFHEHSYSDSWTTNATQHWKECDCGNKAELGNHTGNTTGSKCTVCDKTHEHVYTWTTTYTQHSKKCTCNSYEVTLSNHSYVTKNDTTHHWKECVCGYVQLNSKSTHSPFDTVWTQTSARHWRACECGYKQYDNPHTFNTAGKCTACDYVKIYNPFEGTWFYETTFSDGDIVRTEYIFIDDTYKISTEFFGVPIVLEGIFTFTSNTLTLLYPELGTSIEYSYSIVGDYYLILEDDNLTVYTKEGATPPSKHTGACQTVGSTGPGGGKVIYHSCDGFLVVGTNPSVAYNVEAAIENQGTALRWSTATGEPYAKISDKANGDGIGRGKNNTAYILAADSTAPAAKACVDYRGGGLSDWFLPSTDELFEMYKAKAHLNITDSKLWASSLSGFSDAARMVYFEEVVNNPGTIFETRYEAGEKTYNTRSNELAVRAVRYF